MDLGLAGRVAVVTGGASGLGRETAHQLVSEGAKVLIADVAEDRVAEVVEELRKRDGTAEGLRVDVRSYADCAAMVRCARERLGGLDVLVASAGVTHEEFFLKQRPEDWDGMLDVNLRGVLNACHAVGTWLAEQQSGAIVTIASEAGKLGEKRMVAYSASKGGVIAFTKAFAAEMGRFHVRVNAVCPGVTETPMTAGYSDEMKQRAARLYPLGRLGQPADVAALVLFLASEPAGWITGQAVSVSGGFGRA